VAEVLLAAGEAENLLGTVLGQQMVVIMTKVSRIRPRRVLVISRDDRRRTL
jgi:hypothetical protein